MNDSPKKILKNILLFYIGLAIMAFGSYLTIQAGIGVSSWDCFSLGLSKQLGIKYGNASLIISVTVIILDVLMKEKIGLGTVLNGICYGKIVDLYMGLNICPAVSGNFVLSMVIVLAGMVAEAFGAIYYMKPSLGCGPRDTFKVGIGRLLPRVKIGYIGIAINMIVLLIGWLLGGPVGMGTVLNIVCYGFIENLVNAVMKFEPRDIKHQSIGQTLKALFAGK